MTAPLSLPIASANQTRNWLLKSVRLHMWRAIATSVVMFFTATCALIIPPALGWLVDTAADGAASRLIYPVGLLLLVSVAAAGLQWWTGYLVASLVEPIAAMLRESVVSSAISLPTASIEDAGSGDVVSRITGDLEFAATAARAVLPTFAMSALLLVMTVIGMTAIDWRFAVVIVVAAPSDVLALRAYLRDSKGAFARQRVADATRAQQMLDSFGGADTARSFNVEQAQLELVQARSQAALEVAGETIQFRTRFWGRMHLSEVIGVAATLLVAFLLVRADQISVGAATAAALYFSRLFVPINMVLILTDSVQEAFAALGRLVGVAEMPSEVHLDPETRAGPAPAMHLREIAYSYGSGRVALSGVNVDIPGGEWLAIVGASGAGKSTLARVIAGIVEPDEGTVSFETEPQTAAALRSQVCLITQESKIFRGSVESNVAMAWPGASSAAVYAALGAAGASNWIDSLDDGMATPVGEGGLRITQEQSQQIAIARAVLRSVAVVVLDEATAEADARGARALEQAARIAFQGRTVVVVAHRLSQAKSADRIIVLEDGSVVESGTHRDLLRAGGQYAALWSAWSTGEQVQ